MSNPDRQQLQACVNVGLGERAYQIIIGAGALQNAGPMIAAQLKRLRVIIIGDENALLSCGQWLYGELESQNIEHFTIKVPSGETSKSFASFEKVCEEVLSIGIERSDALIAFGGGVIGDLTGFVAGVINRGINFIQIPTTLLSQVDSSVGGKTAINAKAGKNLIGLFWQPKLVIADANVLDSLDKRDILSGFAEIFKIGLINDAEFFEYCGENYRKILDENGAHRQYAIKKAIEAKARIVEQDEREAGVRALLNLGHTFAHAIEAGVNYDEQIWRHGEAVALGIAMAARFSNVIGVLAKTECDLIVSFIENCGYRTNIGANDRFDANQMLETMRHDKKNQGGKINLILLKTIGHAYFHSNIDENLILDFLKEECAQAALKVQS